jgi:cold shock CspA family protein
MQEKHKGFIDIWFAKPKSFGFIHENVAGERKKYFFHFTSIISGVPQSGAPVRFNVGRNAKGQTAIDVEIVVDNLADLLSGAL